MADLEMTESGNGGDLVLKGNDLSVISGFQNMPYLGMFGGSVLQSTRGPKQEDEQAFDWWGNNLLHPQEASVQFNSTFERKLQEVALSSAGRLELERAVKEDISFMRDFAIVSVSTTIDDADRVGIYIEIQQPNNLQSTEFVYLWDSANNELITETNG